MENGYIKKLFLVDGIGAIVSAVMLGIVLVKYESFFGIPASALYILAILPCFFAAYDFFCYFIIDNHHKKYIKAIAIVNILYCILSISLALFHKDLITYLGWIYIIVEVIIVIVVAVIELKASK